MMIMVHLTGRGLVGNEAIKSHPSRNWWQELVFGRRRRVLTGMKRGEVRQGEHCIVNHGSFEMKRAEEGAYGR